MDLKSRGRHDKIGSVDFASRRRAVDAAGGDNERLGRSLLASEDIFALLDLLSSFSTERGRMAREVCECW